MKAAEARVKTSAENITRFEQDQALGNHLTA
jgi:hypothetical protein